MTVGCVPWLFQIGEFVLTMPDIKIPKRGKIYSFNVSTRLNLISETVS